MLAKTLRRRLRSLISRLPFLAKSYRDIRDSRDLRKEPQTIQLGFKFIGNESMQRGEFEPEETQLVQSIIPNIDAFVNVGANVGYYSCMLRASNVETFAFEPMPLNLQYLMKNVLANGWDSGIEIFPLALSIAPSIVKIYGDNTGASLISGWAGTAENNARLVPCSTLDLVLADRLACKRVLVIMDIEGAEFDALRGATKLLSQVPRPLWLVEVCVHEHQPLGIKVNPNLLETFEIFWNAGYVANTVSHSPRQVYREEVLKIAEGGEDTLQTHNFIFTDASCSFSSKTIVING
ncbi:MAG: FkbM family methyltransferase [Desulforhopalus sp.]